jgi:hypothetical protein
VENSRGKKGRKAVWHLTLGLKDTICAGIGVVGLMMISFALGALAGRGDIYRAAYSWGLMNPEPPRVAAWIPPATPPSPPAAAPEAKKKAKSSHRDHKARDEEMQRLRQEVAQKLKFQNSFDTGPKPKTAKKEAKGKTPAAAQMRVAQYRDLKSAKAKAAELQKKGIKAFIKQGKDQQGAIFSVYRQAPSKPQESEKVAHKPEPAGDAKHKTSP